MSKKDSKSPATTSVSYDSMLPSWTKVQTVLDGTKALRSAGRTFLPQHAGETDIAYNERLTKCTLLNLTKITLNSWVGRPFSDPIVFTDVPPDLEELLSNVDLVGNDVHVFSRDWFSEGIAKAYSHVYVDYPRIVEGEVPRTLADDRIENVRPYWVRIRPEQLFFADSEVIDGLEVLREIRIMEDVAVRVGFAETFVPQIRRIFMDATGVVQIELYQQLEAKKKQEWRLVDQYSISLPVIPLVTFYSDRQTFMVGCPPLEDLADLNVAHWQSTSDQRAVLTVARFPILALSGGVDDNNVLTMGPNQWLYSPDPASKFYYVEHSGAAIEAGRKDLLDLEDQMAEYGAEFLKKRPGNQTATARALDSAEATSPLQDIVRRFGYALNQALDLTAMWLKVESGGTAELSTDFGPEDVDQAELNTLRETRKMRDISRAAYLLELKRRGLLDDEYNAEDDLTEIEKESLSLFEMPGEEEVIEEEEGTEE